MTPPIVSLGTMSQPSREMRFRRLRSAEESGVVLNDHRLEHLILSSPGCESGKGTG